MATQSSRQTRKVYSNVFQVAQACPKSRRERKSHWGRKILRPRGRRSRFVYPGVEEYHPTNSCGDGSLPVPGYLTAPDNGGKEKVGGGGDSRDFFTPLPCHHPKYRIHLFEAFNGISPAAGKTHQNPILKHVLFLKRRCFFRSTEDIETRKVGFDSPCVDPPVDEGLCLEPISRNLRTLA